LFVFPQINPEVSGTIRRGRHQVGVVLIRGRHHPDVALAGDIGSAQHPGVEARVSKGGQGGYSSQELEVGVVEKLEPGCEMLFDAGEVSAVMARHQLEQMHAPEMVPWIGGRAFAKSKLERLVGQLSGGW
jgi:hypothetical protein